MMVSFKCDIFLNKDRERIKCQSIDIVLDIKEQLAEYISNYVEKYITKDLSVFNREPVNGVTPLNSEMKIKESNIPTLLYVTYSRLFFCVFLILNKMFFFNNIIGINN